MSLCSAASVCGSGVLGRPVSRVTSTAVRHGCCLASACDPAGLKTAGAARLPGVRIPVPPQFLNSKSAWFAPTSIAGRTHSAVDRAGLAARGAGQRGYDHGGIPASVLLFRRQQARIASSAAPSAPMRGSAGAAEGEPQRHRGVPGPSRLERKDPAGQRARSAVPAATRLRSLGPRHSGGVPGHRLRDGGEPQPPDRQVGKPPSFTVDALARA